MKKLLLLLLFSLSFTAKSQELDILLLANSDANLLMKNYMSPIMEGAIYSLNNGWFNTAKTHKKGGFDITFNVNLAITPTSSQTFLFKESDYQYLTLESGSSTMSTAMGSNNNSIIKIEIPEANDFKIASFSLPDGIEDDIILNAVPSAMLQASIGLPFSTNISVRFLPKVKTTDTESNLIGFGIKHNLMQYFGPLDKLPLNIAVFGGFTSMDTTYDIQNSGLTGSNQQASLTFNSYTIQGIASLDFPIITVYTAIGFDTGTSTLKLRGNYELEYTLAGTNTSITESVTNPINLNYNTSSFTSSLGARLNLGFFKIYGDYTIKKYHTLSAGFAFSFR